MSTVSLPTHGSGLSRGSRLHAAVPEQSLSPLESIRTRFTSAGLALLASYREVASRATSVREQRVWTQQAHDFRRLFDGAQAMSRDQLAAALVAVSSEKARVRDHIDSHIARVAL